MKLHLMCGARIEQGWVNIDTTPVPVGMADKYLQLDIRNGLPGDDNQISRIYCEHGLEHLTLEEGSRLLNECYRVLQPGGALRISVPSLHVLVYNYIKGNRWFAEEVGWLPATPCQMLNEGMRLWDHKFLYDADELIAAFRRAGFRTPYIMNNNTSLYADMITEHRPDLGDLIVEAAKYP